MMDKMCYHAQKGYYSFCKRLGLLTKLEYNTKKGLIKAKYLGGEPFDNFIAIKNTDWLRYSYDSYLTNNIEALPSKYLSLMDGLDEKSRITVQIALSRLMKLYANGWRKMKFEATTFELREIKRLKDEWHSRIIYFKNAVGGTWAAGDYLMPYDPYDVPYECLPPESLFYKHFIEELGCLQNIRCRDILDVGGYIGDSAIVLSEYTDRVVYSFDPNPKGIEKVEETIGLNGATKIVPVPLGLGDREETLFMEAKRVDGSASFSKQGLPVKVTTLDEWAKRSGADIGLIKVDIEGYEQRFIKGAVETIKKHRPAMLLSIYHNASDLFEIKPFLEDLKLGYRFKIRRPVGRGILEETTLICEAT
jgi:FkbM family methyltransferase